MTGQDYLDACRKHGTNPVWFEYSVLSIDRKFLPPCALAVLYGNGQPSSEYWAWLIAQLEGSSVA